MARRATVLALAALAALAALGRARAEDCGVDEDGNELTCCGDCGPSQRELFIIGGIIMGLFIVFAAMQEYRIRQRTAAAEAK